MPERDRPSTQKPDSVLATLINIRAVTSIVSAGLISVLFFSMSGYLLWYMISTWNVRGWSIHQERVSTEAELSLTLKGMEFNAQQASKLMERLQAEVASRAQALRETEATLKQLQHQRSLLDLTAEQRSVLRELVVRDPSMRDIFTSRDFWLGKILPGLCFFLLGVAFNIWRPRSRARKAEGLR